MTLIAIHADVDGAQIMTDTLSYTRTARRLRRASKVHALPHLDAAVMTHGDAELGNYWAVHAGLRAGSTTFDELTDAAPAALREMWRERTLIAEHRNAVHGGDRPVPRSIALAVGYSDRDALFRAWAWSSEDEFTPTALEGLWVIPSPLTFRPTDIEQARLEAVCQELSGDPRVAEALRLLPPAPVPQTDGQWRALAQAARYQRAVQPDLYSGLKMYVGGDVLLTRLARGEQSTLRLHTFPETGPDHEQMMAGSLHPVGQLGPCPCDGDKRFVDCCLAQIDDDPCPCGSASGVNFADCCRVTHTP